MMATPADLEDFALGFSLTEGLIGGVGDLLATHIVPREGGIEVAMTISESWFDRLSTQRRNMAGEIQRVREDVGRHIVYTFPERIESA